MVKTRRKEKETRRKVTKATKKPRKFVTSPAIKTNIVEPTNIISPASDEQSLVGTKVVNVKVEFIRKLGYSNLSDWMGDTNRNEYIGRKGVVFITTPSGGKERFPKQDSIWANPFKLNSTGTNRDEILKNYETYMHDLILRKGLQSQLALLRGKNLGCWCHPEPCHGDVLTKLVCLFCD